MKVQELIKEMSNSKNKMMNADQLQTILKKKLDVKDYLSIKVKKQLVSDIVNECILYIDGVFKFDDIDKYICFTMRTIEAYTNLELSLNIEDDYDMLCEARLLDLIVNTFKSEYDEVNILLQMKCEYMLTSNSIESQVGRFLDGIAEKLDMLTNAISGQIENFDISKIPFSSEDISKFLNSINTQE